MWMAPRVLSGAWFEKALCEFGQGTGPTPTAMLLLRSVDPELETGAAEAFALKMFFISLTMVPMLTLLSPIVASKGAFFVLCVYIAAMLALIVIPRAVAWIRRPEVKWI